MGKDKKQSVKTSDKKEENKAAPVKTVKNDSKAIKKASKDDFKKKRVTSRFNKLRLKPDGGRGIIYVGHLPRGFAEKELKGFF